MKIFFNSIAMIMLAASAQAKYIQLKCDVRYRYVPEHVEMIVDTDGAKYVSLSLNQITGLDDGDKSATLNQFTGVKADAGFHLTELNTELSQNCPIENFEEQTIHCSARAVRSTIVAKGYVGETGDMSEWGTRMFQFNMDSDVVIKISKEGDVKVLKISGVFSKSSDASKKIEVKTEAICTESER